MGIPRVSGCPHCVSSPGPGSFCSFCLGKQFTKILFLCEGLWALLQRGCLVQNSPKAFWPQHFGHPVLGVWDVSSKAGLF